MSNLEHYFENLLFEGKDCYDDVNKNALTKEEQEAVEICAQYVLWTLFCGRSDLRRFMDGRTDNWSRLIDADAIYDELVEILTNDNYNKFDCADLIRLAPTIEAEPIKHGHWEFTFRAMRAVPVDADITCSVCGATFNRTHGTRFLYCPNCGAKIKAVTTGTCEYCRTKIVTPANEYVMSRKTNVGQRRK